jgi:cytochrome c biogenesis protein CcmG, thiol:disulfide interchange protein DsbE
MHKAFALVLPLVVGAVAGCGGAAASGGETGNHSLIGQPAPQFSVTAANGKGQVALSKLNGKVAIVDFWATWCEPCKKSFPKYQELNVKYQASGLEIIGLSQDDKDEGLKDFADTYGAKFPVAWDKEQQIAHKYQVPSMPSAFIVDKSGIVRFVHLGYHDGEEAEIEREVKSLL